MTNERERRPGNRRALETDPTARADETAACCCCCVQKPGSARPLELPFGGLVSVKGAV